MEIKVGQLRYVFLWSVFRKSFQLLDSHLQPNLNQFTCSD